MIPAPSQIIHADDLEGSVGNFALRRTNLSRVSLLAGIISPWAKLAAGTAAQRKFEMMNDASSRSVGQARSAIIPSNLPTKIRLGQEGALQTNCGFTSRSSTFLPTEGKSAAVLTYRL
jgi:hypothetical protein